MMVKPSSEKDQRAQNKRVTAGQRGARKTERWRYSNIRDEKSLILRAKIPAKIIPDIKDKGKIEYYNQRGGKRAPRIKKVSKIRSRSKINDLKTPRFTLLKWAKENTSKTLVCCVSRDCLTNDYLAKSHHNGIMTYKGFCSYPTQADQVKKKPNN